MKRRLPAMILVFAVFLYFAAGFFRTARITRIGWLILGLGCLAVLGALIGAGRREDGSQLIAAVVCDDPAKREEHAKNGTVDFMLEFSDGRKKPVTVKDKSEQFNYYMGFTGRNTYR